MNIEQEIKKIKYHQKLMLTMFLHDDPERFSFYHQIIDFDLDEQIEKTILNIISLFNKRLSQDSDFSFEKDYFNSINFKVVYDCNVKPTIEEYESYLKEIDIPINPKYLLMAINKQKELDNACQFLLEQYSEK
ncbi:DUF1878 family protein [Bacillus pseudomycoides]|uniref:DUF1878 family protein n=1 Tax=Bacillus pseudomycoides TaxID=64104 RepID=UPI0001A189A7|nr:DUF1878 family protein [Bacillus pseudomycoides]EEM13499.1 hypothetical protein bpmyx0001_56840 [Bacillus pseudomycoides DSM 12442]MED1599305.1 DUF1878 family protein [Bacillus pseudomycoides]